MSKIPITTPSREATGDSMSKIAITTPSPETAGETVVGAATQRRGSPGSLIVIAALTGIVGVVLAITLRPWRDPPSTDGTKVPATISIPVTSRAETLATPEAVVPVAGEDVVAEPRDPPGCEVPSGWVQVCDAASFDGAGMYAVVVGGPGLVAVGGEGLAFYTREDDHCCFGDEDPDADAVVWISLDGSAWIRVPHDEAVFGGDGSQQMFGVTAGGPGLVAVGRDGPLVDGEGHALVDGEGHAAVWTSPDGLTWSRVPHNEAVFGGLGEQRMVSVIAGGPGLVAVGFDGGGGNEERNAAVWTSPDGYAWARVPHEEIVFGGESSQMMLDVAVGGPGLVAVGTDGSPYRNTIDPSAADAAVWTSANGLTWSRVPHDEEIFGGPTEQRMVSVTVGGPGLVAVGSECGGGYSCSDAAVWTSPDGFGWSRVPDDDAVFSRSGELGDKDEAMLSVTAGGPGLVAVGFDSVDDCGWDSAVWTSPDGFTWSRVPDERNCSPGPYDRMLSVTATTSGLVAVGEEHSFLQSAAVWNG